MKTHSSTAGFSLAALIFFLTAASIFIAAAVPAYQMQAKRDLEEELIFRGEEYTRAIQKYQRRFGVYPSAVDQLVSTNGLRFVRRAYKDPINGKDFRLIFINPDGSVTGSKLFQQNVNTQPMFGSNTTPFPNTSGNTNSTNPNNTNRNTNLNTNPNPNPNTNLNTNSRPSTPSSPTSTSGFSNPFQNTTSNATPRTGLGNTNTNSNTNSNTNPNRSAAPGNPTISSGGIIGVASDVSAESIKVYNQRQKYDEWEFIAILNQPGQTNNPNGPNGATPPNTGPNPNPNNPFNPNNTNNPFNPKNTNSGNPFQPTNPLEGTPNTNPFGNSNQRPVQQPFGFGNPAQQNQPGKLP